MISMLYRLFCMAKEIFPVNKDNDKGKFVEKLHKMCKDKKFYLGIKKR